MLPKRRVEHVDSRTFALDPWPWRVATAVPLLQCTSCITQMFKAVAALVAPFFETDNQAGGEHQGLQPTELCSTLAQARVALRLQKEFEFVGRHDCFKFMSC